MNEMTDKNIPTACEDVNGKELEVISEVLLLWQCRKDEKTGAQICSYSRSEKASSPDTEVRACLQKTTGASNPAVAEKILQRVARGMSADAPEDRYNEASALLTGLKPKDETEALLLGQFLALHDSGMKCLRVANQPDEGFYHIERLLTLACKLFNMANQTMQVVAKHRTGGQQTVQVIHVYNEGQAIVAQNVSSAPGGGDNENKN